MFLGPLVGLPLFSAHWVMDEPAAPSLPPLARTRIEAPTELITSLVLHPKNGRLIWADARYDEIRTWDHREGGRRLILDECSRAGSGIRDLAVAPGGSAFAAAYHSAGVGIWDLMAGDEAVRRLGPQSWRVRGLAFTPDGRTLVAVGRDRIIRTWDSATWRETRAWSAPSEPSTHPEVAPDGQTFVVGDFGGCLRRWEIARGRLVAEWRGHDAAVVGLAQSPDGATLASTGQDCRVRLWDMATPSASVLLPVPDRAFVYGLAYSPDGAILATGDSAQRVCVWDATSGRLLRSLVGHRRLVRSLAFSSDGRTLASADLDATILLWDVAAALKDESLWARGLGPAGNSHGRVAGPGS